MKHFPACNVLFYKEQTKQLTSLVPLLQGQAITTCLNNDVS